MKRIIRPFIAVLTSATSAVLLSIIFVTPALAAEYIVSLPTADFATYCKAHGYAKGAKLIAANAYGWRCVSSGEQQARMIWRRSVRGGIRPSLDGDGRDRRSSAPTPHAWIRRRYIAGVVSLRETTFW
jgi:hypothetical protein